MAAESLLVHGGLVNGYRVLFHLPWLVKFPVPQLWRLITPFLLTGNGFSALWDLYMFWTYATGLELNSPRFTQPGDFCTYVIFVATTILVSSPTLHIVHCTPRIICPVKLLCLIRFLVTREITPMCRADRHSHIIQGLYAA